MTQYQQVLAALERLGGKATFQQICDNVDLQSWGSNTPEKSVSRILTTGADFVKEGDLWMLKSTVPQSINLHCSDGVLVTAIAEHSQKGWVIHGISQVIGTGNAEFQKDLFNTIFDEVVPFNSMSGVSYGAVRKAGLWGLIRFRQDPAHTFDKEFFAKALGTEPIDKAFTDPLGREIKFVEEIKHSGITALIKKYNLDGSTDVRGTGGDSMTEEQKKEAAAKLLQFLYFWTGSEGSGFGAIKHHACALLGPTSFDKKSFVEEFLTSQPTSPAFTTIDVPERARYNANDFAKKLYECKEVPFVIINDCGGYLKKAEFLRCFYHLLDGFDNTEEWSYKGEDGKDESFSTTSSYIFLADENTIEEALNDGPKNDLAQRKDWVQGFYHLVDVYDFDKGRLFHAEC